jgi:hypothetical protein
MTEVMERDEAQDLYPIRDHLSNPARWLTIIHDKGGRITHLCDLPGFDQ